MTSRAGVLAAALLLVSATSAAQPPDPIPRFVADVRGASTGLPTAQGWTPVIPAGGEVPSRTLGFEVGGHARILGRGGVTLGIGATWLTARGSLTPDPPAEGTTPPPVPPPEVSTRFTSFAPQVSLNFGRKHGWSYVSAGLGRARVRSEASTPATPTTPALVESDWTRVLTFGGGARWFINDHFGVNFDLRWHQLASVTGNQMHPSAPRETMLVLGVGISLQ